MLLYMCKQRKYCTLLQFLFHEDRPVSSGDNGHIKENGKCALIVSVVNIT